VNNFLINIFKQRIFPVTNVTNFGFRKKILTGEEDSDAAQIRYRIQGIDTLHHSLMHLNETNLRLSNACRDDRQLHLNIQTWPREKKS
jgi:hypothetical protein